MRLHTYCVGCGKVKNVDGRRAMKLGYYLSALSALKEYLQRNVTYTKMTQSQSRLITKPIEQMETFQDPYGLNLELQSSIYLTQVKKVRPDLDDELVLRLLPNVGRRSRKPLIDVMSRHAQHGLQSRY